MASSNASDSQFTRGLGFARFLDIIDDKWRHDRLSDDEIILPEGHHLPVDDMDDEDAELDGFNGKEEEKWNDNGLDYIAS